MLVMTVPHEWGELIERRVASDNICSPRRVTAILPQVALAANLLTVLIANPKTV
jgi:hypothetical protein